MDSVETSSHIEYLFYHIFLPPKLPQSNDYCPINEMVLIDVVIDALHSFEAYLSSTDREILTRVSRMIIRLRQIHDKNGEVDQMKLENAVKQLELEGL